MDSRKPPRRIVTLIEEYPYPLRKLQLFGCKLAEGVKLGVAIVSNEGSLQACIEFFKDDDSSLYPLDGELDPTKLPSVEVSTAMIAEALKDEGGIDPDELTEELFAAIIAEYGEVAIEYDGDDQISVAITAGKFTSSCTLPSENFEEYLVSAEEQEGPDEAAAT